MIVEDSARPVVVVGAHSQSLFMRVVSVPREGETVIGVHYEEPFDGGKATNQAAAAARFEAPVRFVSLVGDDERGRRICRQLDELGVDTRWIGVADAPTDVGFVMLADTGIPAIVTCQDLSSRLDERRVAAAATAINGASVVICQLEAPEDCARAAFRLARSAGAVTVLNPAPALAVSTELLQLTDVVVPNHHEAAMMVGRDAPVGDLASDLAARFPWADILVTAGGDGAYIARAGRGVEHLRAPRVEVVDSTGAGDALVGALAAGLRQGAPLVEAARAAVAAASVSVTRPGTIAGYATRAEAAVMAGA